MLCQLFADGFDCLLARRHHRHNDNVMMTQSVRPFGCLSVLARGSKGTLTHGVHASGRIFSHRFRTFSWQHQEEAGPEAREGAFHIHAADGSRALHNIRPMPPTSLGRNGSLTSAPSTPQVMQGESGESEEYTLFLEQGIKAYNVLRKHSHHMINLFQLVSSACLHMRGTKPSLPSAWLMCLLHYRCCQRAFRNCSVQTTFCTCGSRCRRSYRKRRRLRSSRGWLRRRSPAKLPEGTTSFT